MPMQHAGSAHALNLPATPGALNRDGGLRDGGDANIQ